LIHRILSVHISSKDYSIRKIEGTFARQLVIEDIEIKKAGILPAGVVLRIQKIDMYLTAPSMKSLNVEIHNGRLLCPVSGFVVFDGIYQDGCFDFHVFAKDLAVQEWLALFPVAGDNKNICGMIADLDCSLKGSWQKLDFKGKFNGGSLSKENVLLTDCVGIFHLAVSGAVRHPRLNGEIVLKSGKVFLGRVILGLEEGKILFAGDPYQPSFVFSGKTTVEEVDINVILKGTPGEPSLKLSSDPPFAEAKLMMMLLTGKSWKSTEEALTAGQLTPDAIKDFLDYFLWDGSASRLTQQLGISDISLVADDKTKGIGVTKQLFDDVSVRYSVQQQKTAQEEDADMTQKVGVTYKVIENLAIEGETVMKSQENVGNETQLPQANEAVYLKYKKKF